MISRPAYREALRHIWLRGADGMQIFNATRKGYEDLVFHEVADAVAVYDEMLAHARFLGRGEPMHLVVPAPQAGGVLWSGLRLEREAVVRAVLQGEGAKAVVIQAWPGKQVELTTDRRGCTFLLRIEKGRVRVKELARGR